MIGTILAAETLTPDQLNAKYETIFMNTMVILVLIIVGAFVCVWAYRRFTNTKISQLNHMRSIKIIERRPLSPKSMLYLVEINGKQLLLSESQLEVRALSPVESTEEPPTV